MAGFSPGRGGLCHLESHTLSSSSSPPLQPPRLKALLADHRSGLICRCLCPMLHADKSIWITELSEA
eukprot:10563801-Prorocentrum_lima.AAC.1